MRRWETLSALAGVVCAAVGATRLPGHTVFTYLGIALIAIVALSRLQHALVRRRPTPSDAAVRAQRIRAQRKGR
ncbi:MAG TPA: hypothetical protein VNF68_12205 [Candidatus Baltobacteraceae bacterium]|nr:hypothetical protein [Candidatus Baltobacteraceae bacterium]